MQMIKRLFPHYGEHRLWQIAYVCTLLIPAMLVGQRAVADILCMSAGLLFLLHCHITKRWDWLHDPAIRILFIAWIWICLAVTPLAYYNVPASAASAFPYIRFILLYAALRYWILADGKALKMLGVMLAVLLMLIALDTLWQYVHGISFTQNVPAESGRLTGPFGNVKVGIYLSRLLFPMLIVCLFFSLYEKKPARSVATYMALYFFILVVIAISGERAPFGVSMLGMVMALSMLMFTERRIRTTCFWTIAAIIFTAYTLIITQSWVYERFVHIAQILLDFRHSSYGQLFRIAYELGVDNILHGVGLKNFRELCLHFLLNGKVTHCNLHAHNYYLEWFAEAGAVGLALFMMFVALLIAECIKALRNCSGRRRLVPAFAMATLVVIFFPLVPTQSFFSNWPAILLWYSLGVAMASLSLCKKPPASVNAVPAQNLP